MHGQRPTSASIMRCLTYITIIMPKKKNGMIVQFLPPLLHCSMLSFTVTLTFFNNNFSVCFLSGSVVTWKLVVTVTKCKMQEELQLGTGYHHARFKGYWYINSVQTKLLTSNCHRAHLNILNVQCASVNPEAACGKPRIPWLRVWACMRVWVCICLYKCVHVWWNARIFVSL